MSRGTMSYRWMERLLELLYERFDRDGALILLRDPDARSDVATRLSESLSSYGMPADMLETPEGQNLFVAVLTLRIKFPVEEAREKVRLNIAMREGRA